MRYYEQRYPEVERACHGQVRQIAEMGAYVKLVRLFPSCQVYLKQSMIQANLIN